MEQIFFDLNAFLVTEVMATIQCVSTRYITSLQALIASLTLLINLEIT